jgi:hypothetical protein
MSDKMSEKFVNYILDEKNLKATKTLEKILKSKCANRIKEVLKDQ